MPLTLLQLESVTMSYGPDDGRLPNATELLSLIEVPSLHTLVLDTPPQVCPFVCKLIDLGQDTIVFSI